MKKVIWFVIPILVVLIGCTTPTQYIAANSLERGVDQTANIVSDLSTMAKQYAVDMGVAEARLAATAGDADAAQVAVQKAVSQFDKIGWLQIQFERSRSLIRVGQRFVWSQKGVFDILISEYEEAKNRSDKKWEEGVAAKFSTGDIDHKEIDSSSKK